MLADLLTDILRDTSITSAVSIRNKVILIVFGLIMIGASVGLLFYLRSLPPITVESYYSTEINYSQVYYDDRTEYRKIILISDKQTYKIYDEIWRKHFSPETIIDGLSKSNHAKIWLDSSDSREINAIATPTFSIEPSLGVLCDNQNRSAGKFLAWLFIGFGSFLLIALWF